jgi:hypothetical protein
VPLGLQPAHDLGLLIRQDVGDHLVEAEPLGHRLGGRRIVAGEHHDP